MRLRPVHLASGPNMVVVCVTLWEPGRRLRVARGATVAVNLEQSGALLQTWFDVETTREGENAGNVRERPPII